jgi:hypothetical protein
MLTRKVRTWFTLGFVGVLTVLLASVSYYASASPAVVEVFTPHGTAPCPRIGGAYAPAIYQTHTFLTRFDYFRVREPSLGGPENIAVDIAFPDGRVFTYTASQLLDGVIDMPTNTPFIRASNEAGQLSINITVPGTWPYGCYAITGRGQSGSVHTGTGYFVVVPGGQPGPSGGNATLSVTRNGRSTPAAFQGEIVEVDGRGFIGGEPVSLWITAPDGTVINFPPGQQVVTATPSGAFSTSFEFEGKNPTGTYIFTALGQRSNARVFASFTLVSRPVQERGPATLFVAAPFDASGRQGTSFFVNGDLFFPGEMVALWLTLPDNAVRVFEPVYADNIGGQFAVQLFLDERLPTGTYHFSAQGVTSDQLVITRFTLDQTPNAPVARPGVSPTINNNAPLNVPTQPFVDPPTSPPNALLAELGNPDD